MYLMPRCRRTRHRCPLSSLKPCHRSLGSDCLHDFSLRVLEYFHEVAHCKPGRAKPCDVNAKSKETLFALKHIHVMAYCNHCRHQPFERESETYRNWPGDIAMRWLYAHRRHTRFWGVSAETQRQPLPLKCFFEMAHHTPQSHTHHTPITHPSHTPITHLNE